jgi:hypothetical protein
MFARSCVRGLLLLCLGSTLAGCANPSGLDSVQVTPATQSLTVGQTAQFTAIGTFGNAKHPSTQNITSTVTWTSTTPTVATVSATGLVTGVAAGTTTITADSTAFNGPVSSSSQLTVTGAGGSAGGGGKGSLLSLTIIPGSISVGNLQATGQFLAIGTFSTAPFTRDLTNSPTLTWISSFPNDFPVNTNTAGNVGATAGIVSAWANGSAAITAEATSPSDGTLQTATATFACPLVIPTATTPGSCFPGSQGTSLLSTLTVYHEGLGTGKWLVTAPSATGTQNVLDCGTDPIGGGSICTATYPIGSTITLTATGDDFGGWSYNCMNSTTKTPQNQSGPFVCTVNLISDETVGVIFDNPEH